MGSDCALALTLWQSKEVALVVKVKKMSSYVNQKKYVAAFPTGTIKVQVIWSAFALCIFHPINTYLP